MTTLTYLEFYDNQIAKVENLDALVNLETLDLSFNRISKIENLEKLTKLKTLFFVHNKITKIEGLDTLTELEYLELGDNRITKIENLDNNVKLDRYFLVFVFYFIQLCFQTLPRRQSDPNHRESGPFEESDGSQHPSKRNHCR